MKYHFQKFITMKRGRGLSVNLAKSKQELYFLRLSADLSRAMCKDENQYAILYWDKNNKAIAIQFIGNKTKGALRVTKDKGLPSSLAMTSFLKANNINLKTCLGRYQIKIEEIPLLGVVCVIDL